jgi:hypothetical protein
MSAIRGLAAGMAGLALLEVAVAQKGAAGRVGGLFDAVAGVLDHWLDPNIALIPDLRGSSGQSVAHPPGTKVEANAYQTPRRLPATPTPPVLSA